MSRETKKSSFAKGRSSAQKGQDAVARAPSGRHFYKRLAPKAASKQVRKPSRIVVTPAIDKPLSALLQRAASVQNREYVEFVRSTLLDAARKILEDAHLLQLSPRDQQLMAEALVDPPAPNQALLKAFEQHQSIIKN